MPRLTANDWFDLEATVDGLRERMADIEDAAATMDRDYVGTMHVNVALLAKRAAACAEILAMILKSTKATP